MTRLELRIAQAREAGQQRRAAQAAAEAAAHRDHPEALISRCDRCGAWTLGRCSTPFCHRPMAVSA